MNLKILLINPYLTVAHDDPAQPSPILSLSYLAAYLKKNGFNAVILDVSAAGWDKVTVVNGKNRPGLSAEEIKRFIADYGPDLVGITSPSTAHALDMHETAQIVKNVDKKIKIAVGGAHASSNPEDVLNDANVDIVVIGEGEDTLLDIAVRMEKKADLNSVIGTAVKVNGKIIRNPARPYIENLDSLPFPARELLPMDTYSKIYAQGINYTMRQPFTTMITSRGCPGDCIYCAVKTVWGRKWRFRSPVNVVDEIEELIRKYGIREIHFLDDSVSVSKSRLMSICDEIIKRKIDIRWTTPNGIAIWLMDKALLKKMKQAGCYRLTFGLESGNPETLHFIGKKYDYNHAKEMIKYASKLGIWTIGTFIIGFPYETKESIQDTINFAINSHLDFAVFYIATPFPGTRMHEYFKKEGLIPKDASTIIRGADTKFFTKKQLETIQGQAFSLFLKTRARKPWRIFCKLRSPEDLLYTVKLFKQFSNMIFKSKKIEKEGIAALWKK
ncbi:MAG: radical SAM protein [Candidatus Omnitrophica bacterium]|nr:radical SAM protein [Candidatus Omnitrophota bacterium]